MDTWTRTHPGYSVSRHKHGQLAFVLVLATHLNRTDHTSELLTSRRGQMFVRFVHEQIITCGLYQPPGNGDLRKALIAEWTSATQRALESHRASDTLLKRAIILRHLTSAKTTLSEHKMSGSGR
ncbi:hypothetical protein WG66_010232 [Moniliophthora roreri]|nr:hypothetical protein WG66_010232 [Moniliophthora roreri]